jgi:hypothetical protein
MSVATVDSLIPGVFAGTRRTRPSVAGSAAAPPPGSRCRREVSCEDMGLAVSHVDLAERSAVEVQVGDVEHHRLLGSQPGVIQGAKQCVIAAGGGEHPCGGDPVAWI